MSLDLGVILHVLVMNSIIILRQVRDVDREHPLEGELKNIYPS
jgi:hypothetical protein